MQHYTQDHQKHPTNTLLLTLLLKGTENNWFGNVPKSWLCRLLIFIVLPSCIDVCLFYTTNQRPIPYHLNEVICIAGCQLFILLERWVYFQDQWSLIYCLLTPLYVTWHGKMLSNHTFLVITCVYWPETRTNCCLSDFVVNLWLYLIFYYLVISYSISMYKICLSFLYIQVEHIYTLCRRIAYKCV